MQAQESSLVRQIALARERLPIVQATERRAENTATLEAARARDSRSDIGEMALPAVIDALRQVETRMSAAEYLDSDPAAVRRDASDAAALRSRRDNLQQSSLKEGMRWLNQVNAKGLEFGSGANEYTRRGIGTGTSVGPSMSGIERNTGLTNQLLTRMAAVMESRRSVGGVFA